MMTTHKQNRKQRSDGSKTHAGRRGRYAAMSKSLAGVAYSAVRIVQEVGQEAGKIARKIRQTALPLWFRAHAGVSACVAWHVLQGAQSRRSGRKQKTLQAKSGKLRSRCAFARTQAFQHGCLDMFTKRDTETDPHRHTETRTQVVFTTASARHCPCPGCKNLLGHGPARARELVCTVQAPAARMLLWLRHGCS